MIYTSGQSSHQSCTQIRRFLLVFFLALLSAANPFAGGTPLDLHQLPESLINIYTHNGRVREENKQRTHQGSLFLVYRGETSLEKTPYFQRIYKKLSQTPIFRPFLPIFTYFYFKKLNFWKYHLRKNSSFEINRDPCLSLSFSLYKTVASESGNRV